MLLKQDGGSGYWSQSPCDVVTLCLALVELGVGWKLHRSTMWEAKNRGLWSLFPCLLVAHKEGRTCVAATMCKEQHRQQLQMNIRSRMECVRGCATITWMRRLVHLKVSMWLEVMWWSSPCWFSESYLWDIFECIFGFSWIGKRNASKIHNGSIKADWCGNSYA